MVEVNTAEDRVTTVGAIVEYRPPAIWKDQKAGSKGVVMSRPGINADGNWTVVVRFDGETRWHEIWIGTLEILHD